MDNMLEEMGISKGQPLYLYQQPMFTVTVSVVLIEENGTILIEENGTSRFPGGLVKAGKETIQFSAVRQIKEQTGIVLKKEELIPVDFRSSPERSKEGNMVDIGMVCLIDKEEDHYAFKNSRWTEVDFSTGELEDKDVNLYMDHNLLLQRAVDIIMIMKSEK